MSGRVVLDVVVRGLELEDEWVSEECVTMLMASGFFELSPDGFLDHFEVFQIRFRRLEAVLGAARGHCWAAGTPLMKLLAFLEEGAQSAGDVAQLILDCGLQAAGDGDVKRRLDDLVGLKALPQAEFSARLEEWVRGEIAGEVLRTYLADLVKTRLRGREASQSLTVLLELLREALLRRDWEISALDYLNLRFFESFLRSRAEVPPLGEATTVESPAV